LKFAEGEKLRGRVKAPATVGALIQLANCFDLMDTKFTEELPIAFSMLKKLHDETGQPLPENKGKTPDQKLRRLDCAVLNLYLEALERDPDDPIRYDTVRCGFVEGPPRSKEAGFGTRATSRSPRGTLLASSGCSGPQ